MASPAGEPAGLLGITAAHNQVRANAMPTPQPALPALTWSTSLGTYAQTYADKCVYQHSGGPHGENIYASAGSTPTGQSVVNEWASESANYTYSTNACKGVCGHYTQIVWRKTTQLGCGIANCSTGSPFSGFTDWTFVVCDYDPPGNDGSKPY